MSDFMLTTYDNPFNPFKQFEIWWKEDLRLGYDCCGLLARTANVNKIASEELQQKDIYDAMDEIVSLNPVVFRKVSEKDYEKT